MDMEYEFKIIAGIFIRKQIRQMLESEVFYGRNIRWMEKKGFIESVFTVIGEYTDAQSAESRINEYCKVLGV